MSLAHGSGFFVALVAALFTFDSFAQSLMKCIDESGKVTYSNLSCPSKTGKQEYIAPAPQPSPSDSARARSRTRAIESELTQKELTTNREMASQAGKLVQGQTEAQVRHAWGEPTRVNREGGIEQWVYPGRGYVYIKDGKVRTHSDRPQ
jgi:hypothetical protein